jgi:hypothetical protein
LAARPVPSSAWAQAPALVAAQVPQEYMLPESLT